MRRGLISHVTKLAESAGRKIAWFISARGMFAHGSFNSRPVTADHRVSFIFQRRPYGEKMITVDFSLRCHLSFLLFRPAKEVAPSPLEQYRRRSRLHYKAPCPPLIRFVIQRRHGPIKIQEEGTILHRINVYLI